MLHGASQLEGSCPRSSPSLPRSHFSRCRCCCFIILCSQAQQDLLQELLQLLNKIFSTIMHGTLQFLAFYKV